MDQLQIISIFCICDDLVKTVEVAIPQKRNVTNSEVMLIGIVAALHFGGNLRKAALFLSHYRYISGRISEGRLNRRIHAISIEWWIAFNALCHQIVAGDSRPRKYAVDSFPLPVCAKVRANRCRLFPGKVYRGYTASKKEYFHGLKCHAVVAGSGQLITFLLAPGSYHDMTAVRHIDLGMIPRGIRLYADAAYTDYGYEDKLHREGVHLLAARKYNAKRQHSLKDDRLISKNRKVIETSFSRILSRFPRKVQASTPEGYELKITLFLLADSVMYAVSN